MSLASIPPQFFSFPLRIAIIENEHVSACNSKGIARAIRVRVRMEMCSFSSIEMTSFNVLFLRLNFSQCTILSLIYKYITYMYISIYLYICVSLYIDINNYNAVNKVYGLLMFYSLFFAWEKTNMSIREVFSLLLFLCSLLWNYVLPRNLLI